MGASFSGHVSICSGCDPKPCTPDKTLQNKRTRNTQNKRTSPFSSTNELNEEYTAPSPLINDPIQPLPFTDHTLAMDSKTMELLLNFGGSFGALLPDTEETLPQYNEYTSDDDTTAPNEDIIIQSQKRLSGIANISDLAELEDTIRSNYDNWQSLSDRESDTPYTPIVEEEQKEIERLKSKLKTQTNEFPDTLPKKSLVALYSNESKEEWDKKAIDGLHDEMAQQFEVLTKQATPRQIKELNRSGRLSQVINITPAMLMEDQSLELPSSCLIRPASEDNWKKQEIDRQKEEMIKEMLHLQLQTTEHSSVT